MGVFKVKGGKKLSGSLTVQGAKNSALPILAATLLIKDKSVLHNCPDLTDTSAALKILVMLGCVCVRDDNTVIVDARDAVNYEISKELMREMRSSIVFLGAIAARCKKAYLSSPGGCEIGVRPIDLHLGAMRELGVKIKEENGKLVTWGGRVTGTTAVADTLASAIKEAYRLSDGVKFEGAYRRSDIGKRALQAK